MGDDLEYHEARAAQEALAAEVSTVPEAAFAHRRMSEEHKICALQLRALHDGERGLDQAILTA